MYRVVILSVVFAAVSADLDTERCKDFGEYLFECCKDEYPANRIELPDLSECNSKELSVNEREMCAAKKTGLTDDDGKIDRSKLVDVLYVKVANNPSLMEDVKSKCVNGDIEIYGVPRFSETMKFNRCVAMQWLKRCTEWDNRSLCQEFKGFVQKCVNFFP